MSYRGAPAFLTGRQIGQIRRLGRAGIDDVKAEQLKFKVIAWVSAALVIVGVAASLATDGLLTQPAQAAAATEHPTTSTMPPAQSVVEAAQTGSAQLSYADAAKSTKGTGSAAASAPVDAASVVVPIPISTEHQDLIDDGRSPTHGTMHEKLEREAKDTTWAYEMEQRLRLMYESQGARVFSVECRSTLCEVQAFGNIPDGQARLMAPNRMRDPGVPRPSLGSAMVVNDREVFLAYFRRELVKMQLDHEQQLREAQGAAQQ